MIKSVHDSQSQSRKVPLNRIRLWNFSRQIKMIYIGRQDNNVTFFSIFVTSRTTIIGALVFEGTPLGVKKDIVESLIHILIIQTRKEARMTYLSFLA